MQIECKNPGDTVWIMYNNIPLCSNIDEVKISVRRGNHVLMTYYVYDKVKQGCPIPVESNKLFNTKEELLKSL